MTAFRFFFADDDEGFELVEEGEEVSADENDDEKETAQANSDNDVIWETEED